LNFLKIEIILAESRSKGDSPKAGGKHKNGGGKFRKRKAGATHPNNPKGPTVFERDNRKVLNDK
jgi:hypothetical protein